jgi:hypothetical protein
MTTKTETRIPSIRTVLEAARADLKAFFDKTITFAEKRSKAAFRFARSLTKRLGAKPAKR